MSVCEKEIRVTHTFSYTINAASDLSNFLSLFWLYGLTYTSVQYFAKYFFLIVSRQSIVDDNNRTKNRSTNDNDVVLNIFWKNGKYTTNIWPKHVNPAATKNALFEFHEISKIVLLLCRHEYAN